jgi:hypothetical protein
MRKFFFELGLLLACAAFAAGITTVIAALATMIHTLPGVLVAVIGVGVFLVAYGFSCWLRLMERTLF